MSVTDGMIEEELRKMVAAGADEAIVGDDDALITEANRRARARGGLMTTNAPSAETMGHWEAVLSGIRGTESASGDAQSTIDDGVRAQLIP